MNEDKLYEFVELIDEYIQLLAEENTNMALAILGRKKWEDNVEGFQQGLKLRGQMRRVLKDLDPEIDLKFLKEKSHNGYHKN